MSTVASNTVESNKEAVGGLCHLMEAATALSKLVEASAPPAGSTSQTRSVISDDDESCKKSGRASTSSVVSRTSTSNSASATSGASTNNKREIFPQRLLAILSDPSLTEIVTWLPNGKSFVIVRPDVFTELVLPKYLPPADARGSTKYPSFTRKLNRWGFRQVTRGPDTGAFHHPLFQRDAPHLCLQMVCQRSRDRRSSGSTNKQRQQHQGRAKLNLPSKDQQQTLAPSCVSAVSLDGQSSTASLTSRSTASLTSSNGSQQSAVSGFLRMSPTASTPATIHPASGPATAAVNMAVAKVVATPSTSTPSLMSGYVPKNEALIQEALKQSQEQERLRAAKAMLYHAYLQALGQASTASGSFPPQHQQS